MSDTDKIDQIVANEVEGVVDRLVDGGTINLQEYAMGGVSDRLNELAELGEFGDKLAVYFFGDEDQSIITLNREKFLEISEASWNKSLGIIGEAKSEIPEGIVRSISDLAEISTDSVNTLFPDEYQKLKELEIAFDSAQSVIRTEGVKGLSGEVSEYLSDSLDVSVHELAQLDSEGLADVLDGLRDHVGRALDLLDENSDLSGRVSENVKDAFINLSPMAQEDVFNRLIDANKSSIEALYRDSYDLEDKSIYDDLKEIAPDRDAFDDKMRGLVEEFKAQEHDPDQASNMFDAARGLIGKLSSAFDSANPALEPQQVMQQTFDVANDGYKALTV